MSQVLVFYGLKWNPFMPDIPLDGIVPSERWAQFFWRVENLIMDGGFAMINGESGLGKSIMMRALADRISRIRDIQVREISRPQSGLTDFYRELGQLFGIELKVSSRYSGYKILRDKWQTHIDSSLLRPILLIDEAQEMQSATMSELRLLTSKSFDSQLLLTVIFSGDQRLATRLQNDESLVPLGTRIRTRFTLEPYSKSNLITILNETLNLAGRPDLMTEELINTLCEHSVQNLRILMGLCNEILNLGFMKKQKVLDVNLFFDLFPPPTPRGKQKQSKI
jgi:type II secretory pathway predicted ATPase ExeA